MVPDVGSAALATLPERADTLVQCVERSWGTASLTDCAWTESPI